MKIIKFAAPLIAVVAFTAYSAHQELVRQTVATADAGALPETKAIVEKMYATSRANHLKKQARLAAR